MLNTIDKQLLDQVVMAIIGQKIEKLLGVPQLSAGTRVAQADAFVKLAIDWVIKLKTLLFDTTASHTGQKNFGPSKNFNM